MMMMIQEQPPLPQPHIEERLLSFTLLSYGKPEKVLQRIKIKEKESIKEKTRAFLRFGLPETSALTLFDLDFL